MPDITCTFRKVPQGKEKTMCARLEDTTPRSSGSRQHVVPCVELGLNEADVTYSNRRRSVVTSLES